MYYRCLTLLVSMIVLAPVLAKAAEPATVMGPAVGADKKLIKWGADTPVSSWLRDNAAAMEAMWPFDGVVIRGDIAIGGRRAPQHGQLFAKYKFTYDQLKHIVDDVKAAKLQRFTDNFMTMSQSIDDMVFKDESGKEMDRMVLEPPDWFDDDEFAITVANWVLAARICREAGLKGFMLDFELWATTNGKYPRAWDYTFNKKHNSGVVPSFDACYKKWRQRGRELMAAVCAEYPDITMINYHGSHDGPWQRVGTAAPVTDGVHPLSTSDYGLFAPFLDGMLEGIPDGSKALIFDGGPMYHATYRSRFKSYREHTYARSRKLCEVPGEFDDHMRLAFATWIDGRGWRTNPDWSWPWQTQPPYHDNQFTPAENEHSLYCALLEADKYVWLWTERAVFFPKCGFAMAADSPITVNEDYRQALLNCRKPHALNFKRDDRGASADPPSTLPRYDEQQALTPLKDKYEYIASLPVTWRFWADDENISTFGGGSIGKPGWQLDGQSYSNWRTIRTDDYFENQGVQFNGHAWYHTEFDIPASLAGKKISLHFPGITLHPVVGSQIHVNGKLHWGLLAQKEHDVLVVDITEAATPGSKNVVVIKIFNYGGPGGIYRSVKLAVRR